MERYTFDAVSRTLVMSADFARALNDYNSAESKLYRRMLKEIPNLNVERKTHKRPTSYIGANGKRSSCYPTKKLSYERMEKYMGALPEGQKFLDEYNKLRDKLIEMGLTPYATVARWFMKQFPLYRENPLFYVKNSVEIVDYAAFLESAA